MIVIVPHPGAIFSGSKLDSMAYIKEWLSNNVDHTITEHTRHHGAQCYGVCLSWAMYRRPVVWYGICSVS